jgi:hypothetical protein
MKRLKQLIYILVFMSIGFGILHAADLKDGFLGIRWATNISNLADLVKVSEKNDVSYYRNPKKSYTVFDIETPHVVFGFYKDKFFSAYVQVESIQVFNRVIDHLTQKFGPPKKILKVLEQQTIYRWKHEDTKIKLKLHEQEGKMKLSFYYAPLSVKANEAQQTVFPTIPKPSSQSEDRKLKDAMEVMGF